MHVPLNSLLPDTHGTRRIPRKRGGWCISLIISDVEIASISDHSNGKLAMIMALGVVILSTLKRYWSSGTLFYHVRSWGLRAGETAPKTTEKSHIAVSNRSRRSIKYQFSRIDRCGPEVGLSSAVDMQVCKYR